MNYTAKFPMDSGGISGCLIYIEQTLKAYRMSQRDLMEALLISEEALLLLEEHAPQNAEIQVDIVNRLGVPRIRFVVPGTVMSLDEHVETVSIDQIGAETETAIRGIMLRSYADSIKYRHNRTGNIFTITTGIPERVLATRTVTAIVSAVLISLLMRQIFNQEILAWVVNNLLGPIESLFISALMCITAPAVFVSITCSMFRFDGFSDLNRIGKKVVANYIFTSLMATVVGAAVFMLFKPGQEGIFAVQAGQVVAEKFSLLSVVTTLIPPNIIEPFISVNSIQLMLTAIVIGTALNMSGKRVMHLKTILEELDVLCGKVSSLVMKVVPMVVFCSTSNVILSARTRVFVATAELIITLLAGLAVMLVMYCVILVVAARLNPVTFLKKYLPTMKNTFLKGSGVAAIPMTMRICRRRLGIPQNICSFSIPLGATINMDGNSICLIICSLFFARSCGVMLHTNQIIILLLLVMILSLGAPIAPGTLILCLVTLLSQMGIDTGVLSIIIGINFILEMLLGMMNTFGDVVVALAVSKQEGVLDLNIYNKK